MLEPIPFLGWFNWFEEQKPMTEQEITKLAEKHLAGFSQFNCCNTTVEGEIEFARAIEEYHGIK